MTSSTEAADAAIALVTKHLAPKEAGLSEVRAIQEEGVEAGKLAAALVLLAIDIARAGAKHGALTADELVQEVAKAWQARRRQS